MKGVLGAERNNLLCLNQILTGELAEGLAGKQE